MENNFVKNLASDLLALEVNTIIKEDMSGRKIPSNKRVVFIEIAEMYRNVLIEHGICELATGTPSQNPSRIMLRWGYAGEFSFKELAVAADKAVDMFDEKIKNAKNLTEDDLQHLKREKSLCTRIKKQSYNIVGLFKDLKKGFAPEIAKRDIETCQKEGYYQYEVFDESLPEYAPHPVQMASSKWNNDVYFNEINQIPDLELSPDQISMVRKVWEIGTQQILLQTIIQIDGDITSYITTPFLELPKGVRDLTFNIHNQSVVDGTKLWQTLFDTIAKFAGQTLGSLFGKK